MSVERIVTAHIEAWNAPSGSARQESIANVYTTDVFVGEPDGRLTGRAGVEQAITTLHAQLAGMSISRSGPCGRRRTS